MKVHRIAAYFAPSFRHPLWAAGSQWLGREAVTNAIGRRSAAVSPEPLVSTDLTQAASRYGFHATLKPPFALSPGKSPEAVFEATRQLVSKVPAFPMPELSVQILDGFLALRPASRHDAAMAALNGLAETLVRGLDAFRLPEATGQVAERAMRLTSKQKVMLDVWGYPFVLDTWRFHMTLSRRLDQLNDRPERELAAARRHFAASLDEPLWCRDFCLFVESAPSSSFVCWQRVPLASSV